MLLAILITVFALGTVWVYVIPMLQGFVPASVTSNKLAMVAATGLFLLITVWIVSVIVKAVGGKKLA